MKQYDVIVIGAGPAGIEACLYLQHSNLKTLLIEKATPGGRVLQAAEITNYAGGIDSGINLAQKMFEGLDLEQVDFLIDEVTDIKKDVEFIVTTKNSVYTSKRVIVASGFTNKPLTSDEAKFIGLGVSYCAMCDAPLVRGKDILVYGSGAKAIEEASYLATLANKVYLLTNKEIPSKTNIETILGGKIKRFIGDSILTGVELENGQILNVQMAFIYNGYIASTSFLQNLRVLNNQGLVEVNQNYETKIKGLFAIGDVNNTPVKQVATAVGQASYVTSMILRGAL